MLNRGNCRQDLFETAGAAQAFVACLDPRTFPEITTSDYGNNPRLPEIKGWPTNLLDLHPIQGVRPEARSGNIGLVSSSLVQLA